jgi:3-oxoacyl-[acyl-carrier protein] reductase
MILMGKVALVTGATRGIGRAIASRLAHEGAIVAINGRSHDGCEAAARQIDNGAFAIPGDIGQPGIATDLVDAVLARCDRLDILINNAGIALDNFVSGITDDRWERTLATNLTGPLYLIRSAVRPMKAQGGGVIVNITSWAGIRGNVGQAAYSATKAGVYGLTLTCAKELGKFGVRVNALAPAVATEMSTEMPDHLKDKSAKRKPLRIDGTVDDVAEAALFLASDRSRFITGQLINVDGGMHLT